MDQLSARHVFWSTGGNPFEENHFGDHSPTKSREGRLADLTRIDSAPDDMAEHTVNYWRKIHNAETLDVVRISDAFFLAAKTERLTADGGGRLYVGLLAEPHADGAACGVVDGARGGC